MDVALLKIILLTILGAIERDTMMVEYQVKKGGFLDVDLRVEDPTGGVLHETQRKNDGRVTLAAQLSGKKHFLAWPILAD